MIPSNIVSSLGKVGYNFILDFNKFPLFVISDFCLVAAGEEVKLPGQAEYDRAHSASPQPRVESVGLPEENVVNVVPTVGGGHATATAHGLVESFGAPGLPSNVRHPTHPHPQEPQGTGEFRAEEQQPPVPVTATTTPSTEETGKNNKAKTDFFQFITAAADEPRSKSLSFRFY